MKIQPGLGHIFESSSMGFSIDTSEQFPSSSAPRTCQLTIYGLRKVGSDYFINISPGTVNNIEVVDNNNVSLNTVPPPDQQVFVGTPLTASVTTNYIYLVCQNDGGTPPIYPDPTPYTFISATVEVDDNDYGHLLIGIVQGTVVSGADVLTITNYKGCNSIWTERFKCGSSDAVYFWSAV
jgi:hypothetical protein